MATHFADVKNADAAVEFLSQKHEKPFFMYYRLFRPHSPYTAPKRFWDMYKDANITLPPGYLENDLDDVPKAGSDLVDSMKVYRKKGLTKKEVWLELMRAYCANYSFADWNIGRVLKPLIRVNLLKTPLLFLFPIMDFIMALKTIGLSSPCGINQMLFLFLFACQMVKHISYHSA